MVEIMDLTSGNVIGGYGTIDQALAVVRDGVDEHGAEAMSEYALVEHVDGELRVIAMDQALLDLAIASAPASAQTA